LLNNALCNCFYYHHDIPYHCIIITTTHLQLLPSSSLPHTCIITTTTHLQSHTCSYFHGGEPRKLDEQQVPISSVHYTFTTFQLCIFPISIPSQDEWLRMTRAPSTSGGGGIKGLFDAGSRLTAVCASLLLLLVLHNAAAAQ
jgi:hypothetical protein